jgi:hypothetical protein
LIEGLYFIYKALQVKLNFKKIPSISAQGPLITSGGGISTLPYYTHENYIVKK